jgi:YesN/AraC family two-component response regulator
VQKKYLRKEELKVSDISDKLRFSSPRYFYEVFKKLTGITTKEYRNEFES